MNIASWMPTDQGSGAARQWLRVANEIQMTWHGHPVNEAREERGQLAVNALWLSGTGAHGLGRSINRLREYERIHSRLPLLVGYAECNADTADAADAAKAENAAAVGPVLKTWEGFIDPARRQDWSAWRNAAQALDAGMASVVAGLRSGRVASLDMILCAEQTLRIVRVRRSDFWKFWRRGSAVELFAEQD